MVDEGLGWFNIIGQLCTLRKVEIEGVRREEGKR